MHTLLSQNNRPSNEPTPGASPQGASDQGHLAFVAMLLVGLTLALRFAPLPENFSAFGALAVFCGLYTAGAVRWWLPLISLFLADCIGHFAGIPGMGFYHLPSMLLNYLGFAAMSLFSASMSKWSLLASRSIPTSFAATSLVAMIASALFFLVSNFGAWLDPLMQYEKSPAGLFHCYVAGIPFWRSTLISDVLFTLGFSLLATLMSPVLGQLAPAKQRTVR